VLLVLSFLLTVSCAVIVLCAFYVLLTVNQEAQFTTVDAGVFTGLNVEVVDMRGNVGMTASSINPNAFQSSTVTKILLPAAVLCPSVEGVGLVRPEYGPYASNYFTEPQCPPPQ
jgi:hypothetical protein